MNNNHKKIKLSELASLRSQDKLNDFPDGYMQVEAFNHGGFNTKEFVSPWNLAANNVNSKIMLVGQDWASVEKIKYFSNEVWRVGYDSKLRTNKNLTRLLLECFDLNFSDIYATNLFPFIKPGSMSARIPTKLMKYSAQNYTLHEISIVKPKLVICLGQRVYEVLVHATSGQRKNWRQSLDDKPSFLESTIVASPHTGSYGERNIGGFSELKSHWLKIACIYGDLVK